MSIKQSAAFLVVMAAITLAGAGCLASTSPASRTPAAPQPAVSAPAAPTATVECPEGTAWFASATSDPGFGFCHESSTTGGGEIAVVESDGTVTLYEKTNPTFVHTVRALTIAPTEDIVAAIEQQFMTEESRAFCDVVEHGGTQGSQFVIAGGDLDTQERCGDFRAGYFISNPADPFTLFYLEIGQDTFMPSDTWIKTLRPLTK